MNVYDGERMAEMLGAEGYVAAADGADADLVVLNTCHIREKAAEKVYSDIGRLKRADGSTETFEARCRIDTVNELEYFLNGGILQYVLRKLAA